MNEFWRMLTAISNELRALTIAAGFSRTPLRIAEASMRLDDLVGVTNKYPYTLRYETVRILEGLGMVERTTTVDAERARSRYALSALGERAVPYAAHALVWSKTHDRCLRDLLGEINLHDVRTPIMRFHFLNDLADPDAPQDRAGGWRELASFAQRRRFNRNGTSVIADDLERRGLIETKRFSRKRDLIYRAGAAPPVHASPYRRRIQALLFAQGMTYNELHAALPYQPSFLKKELSVLCKMGVITRDFPPFAKRILRATPEGIEVRDTFTRPIQEHWMNSTGPVLESLIRFGEDPASYAKHALLAYKASSPYATRMPFAERREQFRTLLSEGPLDYKELRERTGLEEMTLRRYLWLLQKEGTIDRRPGNPGKYVLPHP